MMKKHNILSTLIIASLVTQASPVSPVKVELERKAAAGDITAHYVLSYFACIGIEGPQDTEVARTHYAKIINNETCSNHPLYAEALWRASLDMFLTHTNQAQDMPDANSLMFKAAAKGSSQAISDIGICHYFGIAGLEQNYKKAASYLQQASYTSKSVPAILLGLCFLNGTGVVQSDSLARAYFAIAAKDYNENDTNKYHSPEKHVLLMNEGADFPSRHAYFESLQQRADVGDTTALNYLGFAYETGHFVPRLREKAIECYEKAADAESLYNAGLIWRWMGNKENCYRNLKQSIDLGLFKGYKMYARYLLDSPSRSIRLKEIVAILEKLTTTFTPSTRPHAPDGATTPFMTLASLHFGHYNTDTDSIVTDKVKAIKHLLQKDIDPYAAPYLVRLLEEYKAEVLAE